MNKETTPDEELKDIKDTENGAENSAEENVEKPNEETPEEVPVEDFQAKYDEVNDRFLRLYSEFENFRRRTAKEKIDILSNAKGESLKSMLPVVDDFERAILNNDNTEEVNALKNGFNLIHQKFMSTLQQNGLKPTDTKVGDDFDTDKHEAITQIPAPNPDLKGKVVDIVEKGYATNDKVIRYAKVVIGS
jgi:molecular chaperone GrpE